jgi:hypothetical protein
MGRETGAGHPARACMGYDFSASLMVIFAHISRVARCCIECNSMGLVTTE